MSNRIFAATRKGLFTIDRRPGGSPRWTVSRTSFRGAPISMVLQDPRDGALHAALAHGHFGVKLHRSRDGGESWEECGVPAYPADAGPAYGSQDGGGERPAALRLVTALEAGGPDEPGVLWAGTIPGGLFRSADGGSSWELVRGLWDRPERKEWFGGGYDHAAIHSIALHPRNPGKLTAGVSCGGVWVTEDGGASWAQGAHGMRAEYMPPEMQGNPNIQDPHRLVQCREAPDCFWVQHHNGIFRSTDGAMSWREVKGRPTSFGFAVAVHPRDPGTAWFVPAEKDECRTPQGGRFVVSRTRDGGETFEVLTAGLPEDAAHDLVYRHALDVDGTGSRLAMGSTTGGVWISENGGDSWEMLGERFPPVYCVRFGARD